jgi:hypothetical protein
MICKSSYFQCAGGLGEQTINIAAANTLPLENPRVASSQVAVDWAASGTAIPTSVCFDAPLELINLTPRSARASRRVHAPRGPRFTLR